MAFWCFIFGCLFTNPPPAMKKTATLFFIAIFALSMVVRAQAQQRNCGTMDYLQKQITADPSVKTAMDNLKLWTDNWVKNNPNYDSKTVITVPVVVHIIYSTTAQNISDARVIEQINATNTDFLGQNAHSMGSFSSSLKANTNIQFCLAQRKPDGTATTGIERKQTTHANFGAANDDERYTSKGGLDAWDATKYFNIWVCDLGSSLCGYSQFPYAANGGGVNSTYGSSINYQFFGITGAVSPYNLGGTLTHEVGHCLNLFHIWGDDSGACTGTDNCTDTPNQANSTTGHHTGTLTDGCTSTTPGIMYQNFMDYSDDLDYANFTPNQNARIQALFASGGPLYSLTTSNGCTPPSGSSCGITSGLTATTITTTTATFGWAVVSGATSYNVQYRKTGTTTWTSTTSTTNSKAITGLTAATSYEFQVQTVCSSGSSSFTSSYTFTTLLSTSSCGTASGLAATLITTSTATLGWTAVSGATSYNVQYRKAGATTWTSTTSTTNSKAITGLTAASSYEFQVQTVCSSGSSSFTVSFTFSTLAASGCSDIYESNNTLATAKLIAVNTNISALIGTSTDVDYFKFTNTSSMKNLKVTLSGLPLDYDMKLYNSSGTLLATSQNAGTTSEAIKYNSAPIGTYYVKVYGYSSVYSATSCYNLIANISSSTYKGIDGEITESDTPAILSMYPNPANNKVSVVYNSEKDASVAIRIIDVTGRVVFSGNYLAPKGLNTYDVDVNNFENGLYIVAVENSGDFLIEKLLIQK
jgi:hypothetical protein